MKRITAVALLSLCALSLPVTAEETETLRYDVRLLGAKIGVMTIAARQAEQRYSARSLFSTAGLVRVLRPMDADVRVTGMLNHAGMVPTRYHEEIDDGTRVTNVDVQFSPGPPQLMAGDTGSDAPPADVSLLGDSVDPLTGLYTLLRDQPPERLCQFAVDVFDGHRLARITAERAEPAGEMVICHGIYQRIAGYAENERRDRDVPMIIHYRPVDGLMRAERVEIKSRYGPAVVNRL